VAVAKEPGPSVRSIGSKTVKGAEADGERGYTDGKRIRGMKE
jgi:hypothetical protein